MNLWEKVNDQIGQERFKSKCREKAKWLTNQSAIEMKMEFIAEKMNRVFEEIERSKHKKIGEWLKAQTDKRAKESALLFEMLDYGLSYYNKLMEGVYHGR